MKNYNILMIKFQSIFKQQQGFIPPPQMVAALPAHVQQRQPVQSGSGFQISSNIQSGKRPQDARNLLSGGPQKK